MRDVRQQAVLAAGRLGRRMIIGHGGADRRHGRRAGGGMLSRGHHSEQLHRIGDHHFAGDLRTGAVAWADRTLTSDVTTSACKQRGVTCGPDHDFGSMPNLFTTTNPRTGRPEQLLGTGQKSGVYTAVDPGTGAVVWRTAVGPGANGGGIQWGSATDGRRIYVTEANTSHISYTPGSRPPRPAPAR